MTGSYGQLTLNSNGSYTYVANQSAADALDVGDTVTDVFNYTVSDGNGGTDIATITITIHGANDAPVAANNTGTINEDATLTVSDSATANTIAGASFVDGYTIAQDTDPRGIAFSNDGKRMFVTGVQNDTVYQYNLTTAFDVSTASYSNNSIDLGTVANGSQTDPRAIIFNNDGTKMFTLDSQGDSDVNEFTLSTAFDLSSTVTFVDSYSISSQTTKSRDLVFNDDGTRMFVYTNDTTPKVFQYNLSTAYDVSTASYSNNSYSISGTVGNRGIAFSIDGKKMFINDMDGVFEYTLSTGFDLSSTITQIGTFNIGGQDTSSCTMTFNNDGTKMFIVGHTGNDVNEYTLTTPFSLTNISGEHDGDVLLDDTDADTSASLTVSAIRTGSSEGSGTSGSVGSALTGTYGQLTIAANGSYSYVANQSAADALDAGDIVTDSFNYTVSDGTATDTAVITITVIGVNDAPVADNETGSVEVSNTLTVTDGSSDLLHGDTDVDGSASLTVSSIVATTASGSATAVNPGTAYNSGYTSVTGSYGTLRVGADGTYQYIAGSNNGTDVFTYTSVSYTHLTLPTILLV